MNRIVLAGLLAVITALPLTAQQRAAETEQEKLGARQFNQAIAAYSAGNYEESIPLFIAADTLIGETDLVDWTKLRFALGTAFLETGKPNLALGYFQWVAERDSSYPFIYLQIAESARTGGKRTEALDYYRKALSRARPADQAMILGRIGELELAAGRLQAALGALNRAIKLTPAVGYFLMRGQLYDRLAQRVDHAQDEEFDYERAIRRKELTEEQMEQATELRRKALEDYRSAERDAKLADTCANLIARSEVILENNAQVISEIKFQRENN
ncbi:MAG: tetratricopeptide repeat protein [Candidatus Glassbacteria bacterium]|nr:tetratricopeptide repeat protein [Candidatus Glassbacteria bacterium]